MRIWISLLHLLHDKIVWHFSFSLPCRQFLYGLKSSSFLVFRFSDSHSPPSSSSLCISSLLFFLFIQMTQEPIKHKILFQFQQNEENARKLWRYFTIKKYTIFSDFSLWGGKYVGSLAGGNSMILELTLISNETKQEFFISKFFFFNYSIRIIYVILRLSHPPMSLSTNVNAWNESK